MSPARSGRRVAGLDASSPVMLAPIGVLGSCTRKASSPSRGPPGARRADDPEHGLVAHDGSGGRRARRQPRWFQLYWPENDDLAASFIDRAEQSGYGAIVVTLDTYLLAWRERDIQNAYLPFFHGDGLANYFSDPGFLASRRRRPASQSRSSSRVFRRGLLRCLAHLGRPGTALPVDTAAGHRQGHPSSR